MDHVLLPVGVKEPAILIITEGVALFMIKNRLQYISLQAFIYSFVAKGKKITTPLYLIPADNFTYHPLEVIVPFSGRGEDKTWQRNNYRIGKYYHPCMVVFVITFCSQKVFCYHDIYPIKSEIFFYQFVIDFRNLKTIIQNTCWFFIILIESLFLVYYLLWKRAHYHTFVVYNPRTGEGISNCLFIRI